MPWAAAAAAAAAVGGAYMQSQSAEDASASQGQATGKSLDEQRREYEQTRADSAPFRATGVAANTRLGDLLGLNADSGKVSFKGQTFDSKDHLRQALIDDYVSKGGNPDSAAYQQSLQTELGHATAADSGEFGNAPLTRKFTVGDFYADPVTQLGMQFGLDEGTKGLNRMAAARGSLNSGAALKDLTRFGTDYTGTKANDSLTRFQADQDRTYNKLAGVSGSGQVAQQNTSALGSQNATNVGNLLTAQGNARGAAQIAQGNAWGNGFSTVGNWWNQQNTLDKILNSGGTGGRTTTYNPNANYSNSELYAG